MAAMGSNNVSMKADADAGRVEIELGDERYTREFTRVGNVVRSGGDPYLSDTTVADLFAFLLESNEARRAVAQGTDLHELIMRPVDTNAIQNEIQQLKRERSHVDEEIDEMESIKNELPQLEERRTELEETIEQKREELAAKEAEIKELDVDITETRDTKRELEQKLDELQQKRSQLERLRADIELQEESIESLKQERRELEAERDDLTASSQSEPDNIRREISQLREDKTRLENELGTVQEIIQFNEEMFKEASDASDDLHTGANTPAGTVTDQLVEDTVDCWTCGSKVKRERITETLDQLRDTKEQKLTKVRKIEQDLEELETTLSDRQKKKRRREQIAQKLDDISQELSERKETLDSHREERTHVSEAIETVEEEIDALEFDGLDEVLHLHKEANQLEFELEQRESDLDDLNDQIERAEEQIGHEQQLRSQREEINTELENLRTQVDRIEQQAVEAFNEHMSAVLDILQYDNLVRIWVERVETEVDGRQQTETTAFELHVVRSTDSGAAYEDTVEHLSESEREVTGLIFALAGYLVHDLYEAVPFMLLDSLEAIDSNRLAALIDYIAEYPQFLVVALLPEDEQAASGGYTRISDI
jgi:chromosome segregation ATPase